MQILEGVYQLLTPFPQFTLDEALKLRHELEEKPRVTKGLPYVLPYMVRDGDDVLLVDCGWNTDAAFEALESGMKEHDSDPAAVTQLLITHVHPDHYGMAGKVKQVSGCEIVMHEKESEVIASRYFSPKGLTEQMSTYMEQHGVPPMDAPTMSRGSMGMLDKVQAAPADLEVHGGEHIRVGQFDFEIIWTPGHAPGHICLYEPNRKILITGDHILPTITPNVSMHAQTSGDPLGDYVRSLDLVADLDVDYVLPAHEFNIKELKKRVVEIRDHHRDRLDEMVACVDRGGSTAWEVAGRVKWATGALADFEPFMQRAAVGETLSHMEHLFEEGRLSKVKRDGLAYWLPV